MVCISLYIPLAAALTELFRPVPSTSPYLQQVTALVYFTCSQKYCKHPSPSFQEHSYISLSFIHHEAYNRTGDQWDEVTELHPRPAARILMGTPCCSSSSTFAKHSRGLLTYIQVTNLACTWGRKSSICSHVPEQLSRNKCIRYSQECIYKSRSLIDFAATYNCVTGQRCCIDSNHSISIAWYALPQLTL